MYTIYDIVKVKHDDGRVETVPCDETVELLALELSNMGLSYPVGPEDEEAIHERFLSMDVEIGQVEDEFWPTWKYNYQVGRAFDEFNLIEDNEYIDYDELNRRLRAVLDRMEDGTFEPYVKIKWRRRKDRRLRSCVTRFPQTVSPICIRKI